MNKRFKPCFEIYLWRQKKGDKYLIHRSMTITDWDLITSLICFMKAIVEGRTQFMNTKK